MTKKEQLVEWLSDAYAMESGIVTTLEKHASDAKGKAGVRAAINKHLRETKGHAAAVKKCLGSLGADPSVLKSGLAKVTSFLTGMPTSLARDTLIKNGIAEFATEHFEIACYNSLIASATELGHSDIAAACKKILAEEKAQAKLLEGQLKELTKEYLAGLDAEAEVEVTETPATRTRSTPPKPRRVAVKA